MKTFNKPDWNNSIINVSATMAEFVGAPNANPTLPQLKQQIAGKRMVVYVVFDGMGVRPLAVHGQRAQFLAAHKIADITSTFPSTTTCATTTIVTNTYPLQHGWFGWSMYFPNVDKCVDIYPGTISGSDGEKIICDYPIADNKDFFFLHGDGRCSVSTVAPPYLSAGRTRNYDFDPSNLDEFFVRLDEACCQSGNNFVYAYCPEPDHTMHDIGVKDERIGAIIEKINDNMQRLAAAHPDVCFVITADHGHIDVEGYVELYKDRQINDMLACPPYCEARATAFRVKPECMDEFYRLFTARYGEDFVLFPSKQLVEKGYFGPVGDKGYLLGDFVAVGTYTNKIMIVYEDKPDEPRFKGHHTSLTDEMFVPLVVVN